MIKDVESHGTMLLYSMDGRHFTFVQIRVELDNIINDSAMESAFNKSCKRFPYFLVTIKENENCLITVPNSNIPEIHHDALDYVIDYKENDGFLFRVSTNKNILTFSWFHGLTDGSGVFNFLKVLLSQYYKNCGEEVIPAPDTFKIDGTPSDQETIEPLSLVPDVENPISTTNNMYFNLPGKKTKKLQCYTFSLSQKQMMDFASKNGGSPNSISLIEIARTVEDTFPGKINKPIGVSTAINAKPFLQIPKAYKPCTALSIFEFNKENLSLPNKELNGMVRRKIIKDASEEQLIPFVSATRVVFKILDYMKDIRTKQLMCFNATTKTVATVAESYVGVVPFGSYEKHIKSIYSIVEAAIPLVEINFINGRFFYSITGKLELSDFAQNLRNRFNNLGFDCSEVEHSSYNTNPGKTDFPKLGFNLTTLKMIKAVNKFMKASKNK